MLVCVTSFKRSTVPLNCSRIKAVTATVQIYDNHDSRITAGCTFQAQNPTSASASNSVTISGLAVLIQWKLH